LSFPIEIGELQSKMFRACLEPAQDGTRIPGSGLQRLSFAQESRRTFDPRFIGLRTKGTFKTI
jgi:hypothetical protein